MSLAEIFYNCLIKGNAWQTVLNGLLATVEISVLSMLSGTIIAAGICVLRMSKRAVLRVIAQMYIAMLRGSPVLLLLMLMYYVVFARSNLDAILVATVAFSLNISAHLAELMRSSLTATDHMQAEAARTLGFSKFQAFRLITLPQAVKIAKPMYQSNIVNLIQWTSVVGYITITDLTRVINNIGSRTMQPLFMICVGMILYLAMAYVTYGIFALNDKMKFARAQREKV
ncbi:MAG: ABC transporter permease subunit [Syntrophomonas sp.]